MVLAFLLRDKKSKVDVALALTFEIRTMTTHVVVFWERKHRPKDAIFKTISEGIRDRVDLADHPALCLIVIAFGNHQDCMLESKDLERDLKSLHEEILDNVYDADRLASMERTRSFYDDIEDLKRELNRIIFSKAAALETLRCYLQRYKHILEFIQAVEDVISKLQPKIDFEPFRQQGIELRWHAQSLANSLNLQLHRHEELEKGIAAMSNIVSHPEVSTGGI